MPKIDHKFWKATKSFLYNDILPIPFLLLVLYISLYCIIEWSLPGVPK